MKRVLFCLLFGLGLTVAFGQAPQAFNFQAVIRDNAGNVLSEKNVGVTIALLQGSVTGAKVYEETFQATTDKAGVISLAIGKGTAVSGNFSNINWQTGVYFVNLSVLLPGSTQTVNLGAFPLQSVPYALYAEKSGGSGGDGIWQKNSSYTYTQAPLSVNNAANRLVAVQSSVEAPNNGILGVFGNDEPKALLMPVNGALTNGSYGALALVDQDSDIKALIGGMKEFGLINLLGNDRSEMAISSSEITVLGKNEKEAWSLFADVNSGGGQLTLYGANGYENVQIGGAIGDINAGGVWTASGQNKALVGISSLTSSSSHGAIAVYDPTGLKGMFYADVDGTSVIVVDYVFDSKGNNLLSAPTEEYPVQTRSGETNPCYVTQTGNQIIVRGTATLQDGTCIVALPADAAARIQENTLTVQVTPLSANSKGLAVVRKQAASFAVAELSSGTGSYAFDWTLTAVCKNDPSLRNKAVKEMASPKKNAPLKTGNLQEAKKAAASVIKTAK